MSKILLITLFLLLSFTSIINSQEINTISLDGIILAYDVERLNDTDEFNIVVIYKNLFDNNVYLVIYRKHKSIFSKYFERKISKDFIYYFYANIESKDYKNLVILSNQDYIFLNKNNEFKFFTKINSIYDTQFKNSFPRIEMAYDIDNDGFSEIAAYNEKTIVFYDSQGRKKYEFDYDLKSIYNYSLLVGGFNAVNSIIFQLPSVFVDDINNDKLKDLYLIYRDKIEYFLNKDNINFSKRVINLRKYFTIGAGYSPINEQLVVRDFDGDGFKDVAILNFSIATIFNMNQKGTLITVIKGDQNGFNEDKKYSFNFKEKSGLEGKYFYRDLDNDGRVEIIYVGTKFLSSSFLLNISVKRSFSYQIEIYRLNKEGILIETPIFTMNREFSIDLSTGYNTSETSLDTYYNSKFNDFASSLMFYNEFDYNNDKINDMLMFDFNNNYLLYTSTNIPQIYNQNTFVTIKLPYDLKKVKSYFEDMMLRSFFDSNSIYLSISDAGNGKIFTLKVK